MLQAYKIDWLAFTLPATEENYFGDIFEILKTWGYGSIEFETVEGRNFYNSGLTLSGYLTIYFNSPKRDRLNGSSDTVNVIFTGQGCTDLYHHVAGDWVGVFRTLREHEARMTRVDIAMDDYEGLLNLKTIAYKLDRGHYCSRKKAYNVIQSLGKNESARGQTVYIGNPRAKSTRDGNVVYRLYDKRMQYLEERQLLPEEAKDCWLRYELMLTRNKAETAVDKLLAGRTVDQVYKGIVRNMITFVNPTRNRSGELYSDLRNWTISSWWDDFVQENDLIRFNNAERDADLYTLLMWLRKSVVPTLKNLERIFEYHGIDFYDVLAREIEVTDFPKKAERLYNNLTNPDMTEFVENEKERFINDDYEILK
ncbi:replication initiation factor domain-containing protein [Streptococcus cameli]